jgi:hypothetical protein
MHGRRKGERERERERILITNGPALSAEVESVESVLYVRLQPFVTVYMYGLQKHC